MMELKTASLIACIGDQVAPQCAQAMNEFRRDRKRDQYRFIMSDWLSEDQLRAATLLWVVDSLSRTDALIIGLENEIPLLVPEENVELKNLCSTVNCGLYFRDATDACACLNYLIDNHEIRRSIGKNGYLFWSSRGFSRALTDTTLADGEDRAKMSHPGSEFVRINRRLLQTEFVQSAYRELLNREPDEDGFRHYYNALTCGTLTREEFVHAIVNSSEFKYQLATNSTGDMEKDWDRRAKLNARFFIESLHYHTEEEFDRSGEDHLQNIILRNIVLDPRAAVLEIGCGIGRLLKPLASRVREIHGVDVSGEMVAKARDRLSAYSHIHVHKTSAADLRMLPESHLDFCFSFICFQHFPKKDFVYEYIREVSRVLKPGGLFRFQVDGRFEEAKLLAGFGTWDGVAFSREEIAERLRECDFEVVEMLGQGTQYFFITGRRRTITREPVTKLVAFR